jgi:hypothetical protein
MAPLTRPPGILVVEDAAEERLPHTAYGSFPARPTPSPGSLRSGGAKWVLSAQTDSS